MRRCTPAICGEGLSRAFCPERPVLFLEHLHPAGSIDDQFEFVDVDGFCNEIECAASHRVDGILPHGIAACNDHLRIRSQSQNLVETLEALAGAVRIRREAKIENDNLERALLSEHPNGLGSRIGNMRFDRLQRPAHLALEARVILDQKDADVFGLDCSAGRLKRHDALTFALRALIGRESVTVVPRPILLLISRSPPMPCTISRA
jgi:hypothetical protein